MLGELILSQFHSQNKITVDQTSPEWLQEQLAHFETQEQQLLAELKHCQIMLRGLRTWQADIERKRGQ